MGARRGRPEGVAFGAAPHSVARLVEAQRVAVGPGEERESDHRDAARSGAHGEPRGSQDARLKAAGLTRGGWEGRGTRGEGRFRKG